MGSDALDRRAPPCPCDVDVSTILNAGRSVQAIHVNNLVHLEVLHESSDAVIGTGLLAEVAFTLDITVQAIGYYCMIPCIVDHSRLICFVIHCRVPNLHFHMMSWCTCMLLDIYIVGLHVKYFFFLS